VPGKESSALSLQRLNIGQGLAVIIDNWPAAVRAWLLLILANRFSRSDKKKKDKNISNVTGTRLNAYQ
jgi:hypothetical protein